MERLTQVWSLHPAPLRSDAEVLINDGSVAMVGRDPMAHFQLTDYQRHHDPEKGDTTYKGWSYGKPHFSLQEWVVMFQNPADQKAVRDNPIGTLTQLTKCLWTIKDVKSTFLFRSTSLLPLLVVRWKRGWFT